MIKQTKGFNGEAFYNAIVITVESRKKTWKHVAEETGVGASTLARMAKGSKPDAASLAALSAWSGINPSDFVKSPYKADRAESMAQISTLLRSDPNLDEKSAESMEAILKAAYERLKK